MGEAEQSRMCPVIQDLEGAHPTPAHLMEEPPLISVPFANQTGQPQTVLVVDDEEAILCICAGIAERAEFPLGRQLRSPCESPP